MSILGIDTSNYTTSVALWDESLTCMNTASKLLPVPKGAMGLRQSEAVFHHTKALGGLMEQLFASVEIPPKAIGVSVRPRDTTGSYMPCFTVGQMAAHAIGAAQRIPVYEFSHQAGHIVAAAFGAGCLSFLNQPFLAFHFSGGTTEAVLVQPAEKNGFTITCVAHSLDLKAGQAVDRVGGMLGLSFPAGKELDKLAAAGSLPIQPKAVLRGADCSLSGIENQCRALLQKGAPSADIARYCIEAIGAAAEGMTRQLLHTYGDLPLLYAGGVMSNTILQQNLARQFGGRFAPPHYSSDNAAGVALLAFIQQGGIL